MAEMSTRQRVAVRDLVEEAKKRAVILAICVVGLSYLLSLTSSSVLVNLPAAASLIILLRYFSLDFEMRRKAATYKSKPAIGSTPTSVKPLDSSKSTKRPDWRRKVCSPVVEDAMDQFTKHLISEWVTDLWYSRLTPDKQGPEELVHIINGALGEISHRIRKINLIDLLTRDLIDLISSHLEHFRANQAKIDKQQSGPLTIENRDVELKRVLSAENKLHPALFSSEAEHKVLQHLMDGLISLTFRPEDLQCLFFRYIVRELLACAVMRPVLNLASPRFINERIESAVISVRKAKGGASISEDVSQGKANGSSRISSDHFSKFLDPSATGVELVQLKSDKSKAAASTAGTALSKDPLLSMDTRTSRSWSSLPSDPLISTGSVMERHQSGGEWGNMLDVISRRKTEALAPENFENMWAKGRNYRKKEDEKRTIQNSPRTSSLLKPVTADRSNMNLKPKENFPDKLNSSQLDDQRIRTTSFSRRNPSNCSSLNSYRENDENTLTDGEDDLVSSSSCTSLDEETDDITGIDAPGTKVWDARSNRNSAGSHIHHPLENSEGHKRSGRRHMHNQRISRIQSSRNRSRVTNKHLPLWKEGERTSFHSGDGQDILMALKEHTKDDDSSDDSEADLTDRIHGLSAASSATYSNSQNCTPSDSLHSSFVMDSFFKLRCEVLGANIVKSDSKTFAVYSISVTDVNSNNSWSIKRRFRHFEELHRRLKEFPEYNLHLPPKHFLSTGLDVSVIRERCKLLDRYLKELLQLPIVSGSIEVWDFLSVDSQTYLFSNSFSILETLSVDLDNKPSEKGRRVSNISEHVGSPLPSYKEQSGDVGKESAAQIKDSHVVDELRNAKDMSFSSTRNPSKELGKSVENGSPSESILKYSSHSKNIGKNVKAKECDGIEGTSGLPDAAADPTLPVEWVPPNLSVPILDLVDVVFQLQEGGWIRRKAFWVAKQVLQLGMGDALDDWLIEKIQLLRKGSVVASGIKRIEQILWPDGIFLTKHPRRQQAPSSSSPSQSSPRKQTAGMSSPRLSDQQQQEAECRANFVYELMIENAPAPVVSLVGRKEYEQCAKDLYFFLQSPVCMKQLAFELLELLLLSAFPEMDYVFKQLHEEKHKFGEFKTN